MRVRRRGGGERRERKGGIREERREGEQQRHRERDVDWMEEVTLPLSPRFSPHPSVLGRLGENLCRAPIWILLWD